MLQCLAQLFANLRFADETKTFCSLISYSYEMVENAKQKMNYTDDRKKWHIQRIFDRFSRALQTVFQIPVFGSL